MESPPYEKQGEALDATTNVKGSWIIHEYLFLFTPPPDQKIMTLKLPNGINCLGFNLIDLASALQISPGDLILNNRLGSLSVRWELGAPGPGATRATNYIFGLPLRDEIMAPVNSAPIRGVGLMEQIHRANIASRLQ